MRKPSISVGNSSRTVLYVELGSKAVYIRSNFPLPQVRRVLLHDGALRQEPRPVPSPPSSHTVTCANTTLLSRFDLRQHHPPITLTCASTTLLSHDGTLGQARRHRRAGRVLRRQLVPQGLPQGVRLDRRARLQARESKMSTSFRGVV